MSITTEIIKGAQNFESQFNAKPKRVHLSKIQIKKLKIETEPMMAFDAVPSSTVGMEFFGMEVIESESGIHYAD